MQQIIALPIIFIGIYIIITLLVAVFPFGRIGVRTVEDFHRATGNMGFWIISIGLIVSFYSGTTWSGWQGFISNNGPIGAYIFPFIATSGVLFYFLAEKIQPLAKEHNMITIGDFFDVTYNSRRLRIIAGCVSVLAGILWIVMDLITMGYVFNIVSQGKISIIYGEIIALVIILIYVLWGGIESIVWTDLLQGVIMLIGGFLICNFIIVSCFDGFEEFGKIFENSGAIKDYKLNVAGEDYYWSNGNRWTSLVLISSIGAICFPATFVKMYMGKDINVLRKSGILLAATSVWSLVYFLPGLAIMIVDGNSEMPEASLLNLVVNTGEVLAICFASVFVIAVCIGTIDILLFTTGMSIVKDVYYPIRYNNSANKKNIVSLRTVNIAIIIVSVVAFLIGTTNKFGLIQIAIMTTEASAQLFPVIIGALVTGKANKKAAVYGVTTGIIVLFAMEMFNINGFSIVNGVWALCANTIVFIIICRNSATITGDKVTKMSQLDK
ncbi:MAG: sodium:solute symporter family protein [Anaerovoracaceae bacterium]